MLDCLEESTITLITFDLQGHASTGCQPIARVEWRVVISNVPASEPQTSGVVAVYMRATREEFDEKTGAVALAKFKAEAASIVAHP